jgi:radical SAM protein with 4Fe4S-binding SPASM domain
MMPPAVADYLATLTPKQVSLLCNVSPQANDSREMISRRHYALERLGERAGVGITVTSSEFEWDFLLQYVREYKLRKRIRIGIAQPIVGEHNDYITPEAYGGLGAQIVRMAQACVKEDVLIGFDCGMTLCMFTPEQIGALSVSSDGYTCACKPVIDIGPDLDVWHCFPLAEVLNVHLNHFQYRGQIQRYYERLVRPYKSLGCKPECVRCDFLRRGQCTGGCLAHAMNALNRPPPQFAPRPSSPLRVSP